MVAGTLTRYNFRVMMFSNWWLLVFPLAASQLTVFWTLITQRFQPDIPAFTVEMVSPLLAAFLCAHTLAAEYRSNMGVILASKPMHIGKIVVLRLAASLGLVWALAGLSLAAYYFGFEPYDVLRPALACIASTLFLALFALTFATLFRHALAGFGAAVLYWALDLPPGPAIHPYFTLKSLTDSFPPPGFPPDMPLTDQWVIAKVVLLVGALLLYALHSRMVFSLGAPMTARRARRSLAWLGGVVTLYMVSGAAVKVTYGYVHRTTLWPDDAVWFRRQFASYGPIPIASLFGPAFSRYVGAIPNGWRIQTDGETDVYGDTEEHRRELREVVDRMPSSIWAPGTAALLGKLEGRRQRDPEARSTLMRMAADRYPTSPYAPGSLRDAARSFVDADDPAHAAVVYRELLGRYPGSVWRSEALGFVAEVQRTTGHFQEASQLARQWVECASPEERFTAYASLAQSLAALNDRPGADDAARKALEAVHVYRDKFRSLGKPNDHRFIRLDAAAAFAEQHANAILAGGR